MLIIRIFEDNLLTLCHASKRVVLFAFMTEEKTMAEKRLLFVSDTHDNHNITCQQNSKVNEKKTSSVYYGSPYSKGHSSTVGLRIICTLIASIVRADRDRDQ